ncbi:unnamed protein product [Polarella glacialis]|uniref:JmjC domain-containing protein n=1 Tax=Polarella glacialis TaxID=89957 RepID=A0A813KML3_POLGL|nr:unnamed protein product [Polarella glacialis]
MGHSVVDSSLLALPSDGGLSAIFGGFSEDEDEDDAGSERRLATPGGLGALDVATSLLVVAALSRSARAALAATGSALASAIRSEVCWRAFLLERLPQGSRLDFRRSWQSTALAAVRGGAKRRCSRCPEQGQWCIAGVRSDLVSIPTQFFEDLFEAAPEQLIRGLERQYLTIGPQRSGARFHVDPFAASAVSLLLHGRKAWALFPPGSVPPGVRSAKCGDRVVHESPPATWWWRHVFLGGGGGADLGGVSFIQDSGDVVFTPSGWWHCTLNLSPGLTVALTRHVCTPALAPRVAAELRREGWGDAASWLAQELRERHS